MLLFVTWKAKIKAGETQEGAITLSIDQGVFSNFSEIYEFLANSVANHHGLNRNDLVIYSIQDITHIYEFGTGLTFESNQ